MMRRTHLDPLARDAPISSCCVRSTHDTRRYAAPTVSRRMSVVAGLYRTCVIDELLEHSPADHVGPNAPRESPRPRADD
jgi:integrase/recombinase XerD